MLAGKLVKLYYVQPDNVSEYFLERYDRHLIHIFGGKLTQICCDYI